MRKPTSVAEQTPVRVVIVTMDGHTSGVIERVRTNLAVELPGLVLSLHAASDWAESPRALAACRADIAAGDLIFVNMLFMEDHIQAVLPALEARQADCDALVCCMSAAEVVRLTRIGGFKMDGSQKGPLSFLKKLRGTPKKGSVAGEQQMKMLRRLPKILRFIPGTAQDVRAYFLAMQYWLAGSDENLANLVRFLINRYADGERRSLRGSLKVAAPIEYPENGLYHPRLPQRIGTDLDALPAEGTRGTVGLLVMRAYVLSGDTAHYDAVIAGLEARGLRVIPAFASGLDARPAVDQFFLDTTGEVRVDAVVSLTGFSLVGGPAFNDAKAAEELLAKLDVPYLAAHAIEFQTIEQWQTSARGLMPVESTMMVAIPELDGATGPMVFAGRPDVAEGQLAARMVGLPDRIEVLVARVERLIRLRRTPRAERNLSIVLFNFPPNGGATGTAASLSVFASLYNTLRQLKAEGYQVELPASVEALRLAVIEGNAPVHGTDANVHHRISAEDHVRREPWLAEIEAQWGPAPGRSLSDGASILVLGRRFGRIFVGIQPNLPAHRHEPKSQASLSRPSLPSPSQKSPRKHGINVQSSQQSQIFISTEPINSQVPSAEDRALVVAGKEPINSYLQGADDKMAPAKCRPCPDCKRKFNEASYKKHVKVCQKVFTERRKTFDSRKHRIEGTQMATLPPSTAPSTSTKSASDEPKWKVASETFRQAIKQAKVLFAISLKKTKQSGTFACEPPIRSHWLGAAKGPINSYLQGADDKMAPAKCRPCPDCKRKFNEASYKKHVKVCQKVFTERRKTFDSRKHRMGQATESASDEPKWKVASETFRQAIKQAKVLFAISLKKTKQTNIPSL
jgi:hypothetical protein